MGKSITLLGTYSQRVHYYALAQIETYKVFENLIGLRLKQKCPVVCPENPGLASTPFNYLIFNFL